MKGPGLLPASPVPIFSLMEQTVVILFLSFFLAELLVEFILNEMNLNYVRRESGRGAIPAGFRHWLGPDDCRKSVAYTLARGKFRRGALIYDGLVVLWVLFGGVLPYLERFAQSVAGSFPPGTQAIGVIFCLCVALIVAGLALPTELFATFVIEERFGFNRTTPGLFFTDKLKGLLIGMVIGVPFLFGVLWLMDRAGATWWLWAFLFVFGFQFLIVIVHPTLIAPLFNKFEPLVEGELRERILALAAAVGFKASGIYTMDGSKRSAHSNAYFTGLGRAKRIVLFDTLIKQLTVDQALAVLAHEVGHYKMKHIRRMLVVKGLLLLAGLFVISRVLDYGPLFRAFGLAGPSHYGALVLFSFLVGPATFYLQPLLNCLSRRHEYEADLFAVKTLEAAEPMVEALVQLTVKNLANLTPHPWYSAYHYSHPTPVERIRAIREQSGFGSDRTRPNG